MILKEKNLRTEIWCKTCKQSLCHQQHTTIWLGIREAQHPHWRHTRQVQYSGVTNNSSVIELSQGTNTWEWDDKKCTVTYLPYNQWQYSKQDQNQSWLLRTVQTMGEKYTTFSSMTEIIPSSSYIFCNDKQGRQCTYNVTQWKVPVMFIPSQLP